MSYGKVSCGKVQILHDTIYVIVFLMEISSCDFMLCNLYAGLQAKCTSTISSVSMELLSY